MDGWMKGGWVGGWEGGSGVGRWEGGNEGGRVGSREGGRKCCGMNREERSEECGARDPVRGEGEGVKIRPESVARRC